VASPWPDTENVLFVAYNSVAEASCFLALGWPPMTHTLDLYVEFKQRANDTLPSYNLLAALAYFGIDSIDHCTKTYWRDVAIRGGPFTSEERDGLLAYCQTDVDALLVLYPKMFPKLDWVRAVQRGRYQLEVAKMEHVGVPMDVELYERVRRQWERIKLELIEQVNPIYGVFVDGRFVHELFAKYILSRGFEWDVTDTSGRLRTDDDYLRGQARRYPEIEQLRQLLKLLNQFKRLSIGVDGGRNRGPLMPFATKTSRNAPKARLSLFSGPRWIRGFIRPGDGKALVYTDWSGQEFGILGALSTDPAMIEGYLSGDPYLHFAYRSGAVPHGTPRKECENAREQHKVVILAQQYGQSIVGLRDTLGCTTAKAKRLYRDYREAFPVLDDWLEDVTNDAMIRMRCQALHGWQMRLTDDTSHRTVQNFFAQANGAEMLRRAVIQLADAGVQVVMPVHDAVLVECDAEDVTATAATVEQIMGDVSEELLRGRLRLRTSSEIYGPGERVIEAGGREMWDRITGEVGE
jgi:DNA polymerase I-like protein with 3'-5' exonuclease and polymerase domains